MLHANCPKIKFRWCKMALRNVVRCVAVVRCKETVKLAIYSLKPEVFFKKPSAAQVDYSAPKFKLMTAVKKVGVVVRSLIDTL